MTPELSLALSLIAAQKLQTPETLAYVQEQEAMYLTMNYGLEIVKEVR